MSNDWKCAILYGEESTAHHHFIEAAKEYFDTVLGAPLEGIQIEHGENDRVTYNDTDLTEFDCVFIRFFGTDLLYGEHLPEMLHHHGVYTQLDSDSFTISTNKFHTMKVLSEGGVPVPISTYTLSTEQTVEAAEELGYPVVIKLITGYGGKGVMMAEEESDLTPIIDTLTLFEQDISLQEYVENPGEDIRVLVIGDETWSYKRVGDEGEFRSNVSLGGNIEKYDAPEEVRETAVKAAKICGFDFCGVDIIESDDGIFVGEINEPPGLKGPKKVLDVDIPQRLMEFMYRKSVENSSMNGG